MSGILAMYPFIAKGEIPLIPHLFLSINRMPHPIPPADRPDPKAATSIARRSWRPIWRNENYDAILFPKHELSRRRNTVSRSVEMYSNRGNGTCRANN